jgi:DNA modification methylase
LRYSQEGDLILDQFVGGGTTLIEAKLLNRNVLGVDINSTAIELCKSAVDFDQGCGKVNIKQGDARNLNFIEDEQIDFICTHPPYANIIQYSENTQGDLSHLKIPDFLIEMEKVAKECYRVLKKDKFCAILMGDTRQKGHMVPLSFEVMNIFEKTGFKLKELIIKEQHNCRATGYWKANSIKYNFLLIAHEYLFVFRK